MGDEMSDELLSSEELEAQLNESSHELVSAYNSSAPSDGAASIVLCGEDMARSLGLSTIARITGYSVVNCAPGEFLTAPVEAVTELKHAFRGSGEDARFTIIEVNEAFGVQLPLFKSAFQGMEINVHGGAIALGHPLGAGGIRILTTLIYAMRRYNHHRGIAAICFGGGGAYAVAVERSEEDEVS